jgi:Protein of unknown function (DUF3306)
LSRDFLSRWSQRKLDSSGAPPEGPPAPAEASADPAPPNEMSAEEIAALPPVESLTVESDVAAFLRKGVPHALRNAALRRAWALDPEIRDYIGDARDYAYDWNVAGGVPGTGPLEPGTDVARMVEDIFGRRGEPEPVRAAEGKPEAADAGGQAEPLQGGEPEGHAVADGAEQAREPELAPFSDASTSREAAPNPPKSRHGGAKPA